MAYRTILVDAGALYALVDPQDQNHSAAARYWKDLPTGVTLLILLGTLKSAITRIQDRLGHEVAAESLAAIRASARYRIVVETSEDDRESWRIFERYVDKDWSPFDCAVLAVARRRGIEEVFSFNRHFDQMAAEGLIRVPPRAAR